MGQCWVVMTPAGPTLANRLRATGGRKSQSAARKSVRSTLRARSVLADGDLHLGSDTGWPHHHQLTKSGSSRIHKRTDHAGLGPRYLTAQI